MKAYIAERMAKQLKTVSKPPKLMYLDDYPRWKTRFYNYVIGYDALLWIAIEEDFELPTDENGEIVKVIGKMTKSQRDYFEREKKMFNPLLQGIGNEVQHQFRQFKTSKCLWDAMKQKYDDDNASVAKGKDVIIHENEGVDWSKTSNDWEASCSRATTRQNNLNANRNLMIQMRLQSQMKKMFKNKRHLCPRKLKLILKDH